MTKQTFYAEYKGSFLPEESWEGSVQSIYSKAVNLPHPSGILISIVNSMDQMTDYGIVVADFTIDNAVGCMPLTVEFTNTTISDTAIESYEWDFGDKNFYFQQDTSHTYTKIGIFTVELIVTDSIGCQDTIIMEDLITSSRPIPAFTTPDRFLCVGDTIGFASTSEGTITDWLWNFGDDSISTAENPQHAYSDSGYFSVSLYLTDILGCDSLFEETDYIHVQAKPKADFTADDTVGACWPAKINFSNQSVDSTYINKWKWDFGDSSAISTIQHPDKTYTQPGSYDVNMVFCRKGLQSRDGISPGHILI